MPLVNRFSTLYFCKEFNVKPMKIYLLSLSLLAAVNVVAQVPVNHKDFKEIPFDSTDTRTWRLASKFALNGTQSSFVNWNAGGRNNISLLGSIVGSAAYRKEKISWYNVASLALGGLQYLGKADEGGEKLQKTDDRIEFASIIGYKLKKSLYLSFLGNFRTQFLDGYNLPNDSIRVSKFMAPGYLSFGIGLDYTPSEDFSLFIAPAAGKITFVKDRNLANQGAFGVRPAEYDVSTGELLRRGEEIRAEFGPYFKGRYHKELVTNIDMIANLELFSNYFDRPQNIDVNGDILLTFKVNSWFSTSLNCTVIYDHDVRIQSSDGSIGPRTQFKSVIGMGVSYKLDNKKEDPDKK